MKYDEGKREMLSRRACSESGPHPDISVPSTSAGTSWGNGSSSVCEHLWGKKYRGQTSATVLELAGRMQPIILRTRRSWPVAPIHCRRYVPGPLPTPMLSF